jgi:hypothetical protein
VLLALLTGCTTSNPSGAADGHGGSTPARAARCAAADLGAAFTGASQPGTGGTALGFVFLWDKSPAACRLGGPVTVTGLSRSGKPVTTSARFSVPNRSPLLSADGTGPDRHGRFPAVQASATLLLVATGAHPSGGLPCPGHQVQPAKWRVRIGAGTLTAPNESPASGPALTAVGGLVTCRGKLGGQSPLSVDG